MTKGAMATLSAGVAVFGFDPEPGTPASRALHVLTLKRTLPTGDLGPKERFTEAALRAASEAGIDLGGGRRATRGGQRLHLVGVDDDPARARSVTVWYYAAAPTGRCPVPASGRQPDVACISTPRGRPPCEARSIGYVPTPGSSPGRPRSSARCSPATISSACTWPSTAALRAASGPSGVASRNCATPASSARCATPRWRRCGFGCPASGRRQAPAGVRPSCSATRVRAARTSSSRRCGPDAPADRLPGVGGPGRLAAGQRPGSPARR